MELVYSMRRKPLKCEPPHFERSTDPEVVRPICTISPCNIIAFSSPTELSDVDGDTWSGHVYVCDLDTPWDSHKVVSTTHPVSALEWDGEGKQLLVATTEGEVGVYGQKDFLLNDWTCLYNATFPGEHIVKGIFFSNGRRLVMTDKKHDAPIAEKIQALRSTPTLKGFGGSFGRGVLAVTASGLVVAVTAHARTHDSMRAHRDHVTHASFAHKKGNILIGCVCAPRGGGWAVRVALAGLCSAAGLAAPPGLAAAPHLPPAPLLTLVPLPTLTADHLYTSPPTALAWCSRADTDCLLVAGSTLTMWKLTERAQPVHKLLAKSPVQGSTTPGGGQKPGSDCFNTLVWQQANSWAVEGGVCSAVCCGALPGAGGGGPLLLATRRDLFMLAPDSHHLLCAREVSTGNASAAAATPPKKTKYGNTNAAVAGAAVCCVCVSALCGVAVCADTNAQLHVFRIHAHADIPTPLAVQHVTTLLEYSLVSGLDCMDVLLTLKPNLVLAVVERITEVFQRQPPSFQQYYYHAWIKMRTALCRLMPSGSTSVSWLTCAHNLWATWAACGAALRPDDRDDKMLAALLDDTHPDHDKALVALEGKAEIPLDPAALAALRRPLQRAAHLALTALTALSALTQHHAPPANHYELISDPTAMTLLRRLVVVARSAGGEVAISRLLARLHLPNKPDLIEECAAVCASRSARVWEAAPRAAVSAPHKQPQPLVLEYGVVPEALTVRPEPPAWLADVAPNNDMDSIRYMYLGLSPRWRQCARCGGRSLPAPAAAPAKHPLQRAHDARFLPACRCGGKWSLVSNV